MSKPLSGLPTCESLAMFVVDFASTVLIAIVLTVAFAAVFRLYGYRRIADFSWRFWLLLIASWTGGIFVVVFGPALTGWHCGPLGAPCSSSER